MYKNDNHNVYSPSAGVPSKKNSHHYDNILIIAHLKLYHIYISLSAFEIQQYCSEMFVRSLLLIIFYHWHKHTHTHTHTQTDFTLGNRNRNLDNANTKARPRTWSSASSIHLQSPYPTHLRSTLMLFLCRLLGLPTNRFPTSFSNKIQK
jgi:hypothetical protein